MDSTSATSRPSISAYFGVLVREREALDGGVEVVGAALVDSDQRRYEYAAFDDNVIPPMGYRYALDNAFEQVVLHHELRCRADVLCLVADLGLELHGVPGPHNSTSM